MIYKKLVSGFKFCGTDALLPILIVGCGLLSIWSYFDFDQHIYSILCKIPLGWGETFLVRTIAFLGKTWLPVWLLLAWFLATGKQQPILIAFLSLIMLLFVVTLLKASVGRPRPREVRAGHVIDKPRNLRGYASFPSGDTASVFAAGTAAVCFVSWRWKCIILATCAAVGLLRVITMAHYPSDVFAGVAIGTFTTWLAIQIDKRWLPLQPPRFHLTRFMAIATMIILPLVLGFSKGLHRLSIFFEVYVPLTIVVFLISKINKCSKVKDNNQSV
jgi:membrane-associated phospholipid phosphatase